VPQTAGARGEDQHPRGGPWRKHPKLAGGGAMEEEELDGKDSEYEDDDSEATTEDEDGFDAEAEGPSPPVPEEPPTR
jgi:hypothetical protein